MKVVEFKREGWRDAAATLRKVAVQLESGELEPCAIGVLALRSPSGTVEAFAFGPAADDLQALALFRLGERKLVDVLLDID